MKTIKILILISGIATVMACNKTTDSITGIYVMSFKNEYSMAEDTFHITLYNSNAGSYKIERRDGFHRIREGKVLPKELRQEHWMATYDPAKSVLQETAYGKQIYFSDDGHTLNYNGTYQKIK